MTTKTYARTQEAQERRALVLAKMAEMAAEGEPRGGRQPSVTNIAYRVFKGSRDYNGTLRSDLGPNMGFSDGTQLAYGLRDFEGKVRADLKALETLGLVKRDDWRWTLVPQASAQ